MNGLDILRAYEPLWGEWTIEECIGAGAQSQVYSVKDASGNCGALKVIFTGCDELELDLVRKQLELTKNLSGAAGLMPCMKTEEFSLCGQVAAVILMPMMTALSDIMMESDDGFSVKDTVKIGLDLSKALEVCENNGIIHRDIKPANVFCDSDGDYFLGDFGVARNIERTMLATRKGTPAYMSPEIASGRPCKYSADIYSLGVMLYQLLNSGRLPLIEEDARYVQIENAVARRLDGERLPLPENAQNSLGQFVCKMCAFEAKERPDAKKCINEFGCYARLIEDGSEIPHAEPQMWKRAFILTAAAIMVIVSAVILLIPLLGSNKVLDEYPTASISAVNTFSRGGVAGDSKWLYFGSDAHGTSSYRVNRSDNTVETIYDGSMTYMNICDDRIIFTANNTIESAQKLENGEVMVVLRSGVRSINTDGTDERILCECDASCAVEYDDWVYHYTARRAYGSNEETSSSVLRVASDGSFEEKLCEFPNVYIQGMYVYRDRIWIVCSDYSKEEIQYYTATLTLDGKDMQKVIDTNVRNLDFFNNDVYYLANAYGSNFLMKKSIDGSSEPEKVCSEEMSQFCICDEGIVYSRNDGLSQEGKNGLYIMDMQTFSAKKLSDIPASSMGFADDMLIVKTVENKVYMLDIKSGEITELVNFRFNWMF